MEKAMKFYSETRPRYSGEPFIFLEKNDWNDWFKWHTLYRASLFLDASTIIGIGFVKIGRRGMTRENGRTEIPAIFDHLDESYFSLGQDENYYETIISLGNEFRENYLTCMRDCALKTEILTNNLAEPVLTDSLLRDIDQSRVLERFHRLAIAQTALTPYSFEYHFPKDHRALSGTPILSFEVTPESSPATNIHVIIGRNGVGKSRCFDLLSRAFLNMGSDELGQSVGELFNTAAGISAFSRKEVDFAGLVVVSFSAFDSKGPLGDGANLKHRYAYIGLITHENLPPTPSNQGSKVKSKVKGISELAYEFADSVSVCLDGVRRQRWSRALSTLESDPLFAEINVSQLAEDQSQGFKERATKLFKKLSSGHAIVLLTITRLVELVEEKSLVLIDEPESHLHPPLLSAFLRALSDLLVNRNGVAIIATHSPVVLQEVPASCVWILRRSGHETTAKRPDIRTFGENVGVLTREVFGLEITQTGFHQLIAEYAKGKTYEQIITSFDDELGAEGRALARALSLLN